MKAVQRVSRIAIVAVVFSCSVGATPGVASAAGPTPASPIKLLPAGPHGSQLSGPSYFRESGRPGTILYLHAIVGDSGTSTATVVLRPVDAESGVYGGVSYNLPNQNRQRVGSWIHVNRDHVHLGPGAAAVVPFQVHIPRGLKSGQYVGGLTAYVPAVRPHESKFGGLMVQLRTVAAVVITIPGPKSGQFQIHGVQSKYEPSGLFASIQMSNTGNLLTKGRGHIRLTKAGSSAPIISRDFSVDTTVPHTSLNYPIPWRPKPAYGLYHASVTLRWWDGSASWNNVFRLGPPPPKPRRPRAPKSPEVRATAMSTGWILPAVLLGSAAVVASLCSVWFVRRRNTGDDEPEEGGQSAALS
jgi:hypothetical protein